MMFSQLSTQFVEENNQKKALIILDRNLDLFPLECAEFDYYTTIIINDYFKIKQEEKAKSLLNKFSNQIYRKIEKLKMENKNDEDKYETRIQVYLLDELLRISNEYLPNDKITKDLETKTLEYRNLLD